MAVEAGVTAFEVNPVAPLPIPGMYPAGPVLFRKSLPAKLDRCWFMRCPCIKPSQFYAMQRLHL